MSAHHVEVTLSQDGMLLIDKLPFRAGDTVDVIILSQGSKPNDQHYPLRGKPLKYVDPTAPVAESDWDSLR